MDAKKMVYIRNAVIKEANSPSELMDLFNSGNLERHTGTFDYRLPSAIFNAWDSNYLSPKHICIFSFPVEHSYSKNCVLLFTFQVRRR